MPHIFRDNIHRIAYSTDASAYREVPEGVFFPSSEQDVVEIVNYAKEFEGQKNIIPRAGGTSLAGQVVGNGIVADVSRHFNKILEINPIERWARVQPGVVLDELNLATKQYNLFFSPETSTSNRCCIGGMFGNNSCGSHSLIYGSTREHVIEARGVLSDGSVEIFKDYTISNLEDRFGNEFWKNADNKQNTLIKRIYSYLINFALQKDNIELIESNFPDKRLKRRNCGYALDEVIQELSDESIPLRERKINLCKLLSGSEGTLAFITEIKVALDSLPPKHTMILCAHCDLITKSFYANLVALKYVNNPKFEASVVAVELMDSNILELSKSNELQKKNRFFVDGDPAAILIVEIKGESQNSIANICSELEKELMESQLPKDENIGESGVNNLVYSCTKVYGDDISKVWSLRKSGLGLLSGMKGDAKPVSVIEDTAVIPQFLPNYLREFDKLLEKNGLKCVYHAHISTGELHLRPILNIKDASDRVKFREIATQVAILVKKYRGSLSGEHGDGRLRGEFIKLLYGDKVYDIFRDLKSLWDPFKIFNPDKIVDTPKMDSNLRYDVDQSYAIEKELDKNGLYFNWKASFDECKVEGATGAKNQLHALMCSVEQCNGAGDCRKSNLIGGTLCPIFKLTKDETKTTRSRSNVIREILTRGELWLSAKSLFDSEELNSILSSCIACKGCKGECPSNVDMTRLRAELLQHKYDVHGTPLRSFLVARMAEIERIGSVFAPLYNFFAQNKLTARTIKKIVGFSNLRNIPKLSPASMKRLINNMLKEVSNSASAKSSNVAFKKKVYIFPDEFTNFQEAELGLKFAKLLVSLGYKVEIPKHLESGRAAISKGCLRYAKKIAQKNFQYLKDIVSPDTPLVGIEPSCILSFRDEYPDLVLESDRREAQRVAESCLLYDEFLLSEIESGNISETDFNKIDADVWLHGHCHQKALVGIEKTAQILRFIKGVNLHLIPSGCCGMAGSFGYEKENYTTSMEIGEMILFPTIRKACELRKNSRTIVLAPGTSCRQQILDGTGIKAIHPVEFLFDSLKNIL